MITTLLKKLKDTKSKNREEKIYTNVLVGVKKNNFELIRKNLNLTEHKSDIIEIIRDCNSKTVDILFEYVLKHHIKTDTKLVTELVRNYVVNVKFEELLRFFLLFQAGPQFMNILKSLGARDVMTIYFSRTIPEWKKYEGLYDSIMDYFKKTTLDKEARDILRINIKKYEPDIKYGYKGVMKHRIGILPLIVRLFESQIFYLKNFKVNLVDDEKRLANIKAFLNIMNGFMTREVPELFYLFEEIKYPFDLGDVTYSISEKSNEVTKKILKLLSTKEIAKNFIRLKKTKVGEQTIKKLEEYNLIRWCQYHKNYEILFYIFDNNYHKDFTDKDFYRSLAMEVGENRNEKVISILSEKIKSDKYLYFSRLLIIEELLERIKKYNKNITRIIAKNIFRYSETDFIKLIMYLLGELKLKEMRIKPEYFFGQMIRFFDIFKGIMNEKFFTFIGNFLEEWYSSNTRFEIRSYVLHIFALDNFDVTLMQGNLLALKDILPYEKLRKLLEKRGVDFSSVEQRELLAEGAFEVMFEEDVIEPVKVPFGIEDLPEIIENLESKIKKKFKIKLEDVKKIRDLLTEKLEEIVVSINAKRPGKPESFERWIRRYTKYINNKYIENPRTLEDVLFKGNKVFRVAERERFPRMKKIRYLAYTLATLNVIIQNNFIELINESEKLKGVIKKFLPDYFRKDILTEEEVLTEPDVEEGVLTEEEE